MSEIIYIGHDNTIDMELREDGVAVDLSSVTRMTLDFGGGNIIDSATSPFAFNWSSVAGKVVFKLGNQIISLGRHNVRLTVYDPANINGIVWGSFVVVVV